MPTDVFAADYRAQSFWWDRSPRRAEQPAQNSENQEQRLPEQTDVAIIGSGFTGLNAAIQTARAGRKTLVLERDVIGFGCSTRNGGQVGTSFKPGFTHLAKRHGEKLAHDILLEGHCALNWLGEFIAAEGIDCDFKVCGRFHAAHTPARFKALAAEVDNEPRGLETDSYAVPRSEQGTEIDSDLYFGGVVRPWHAALDPGLYHQGLLNRAEQAGASVVSHCEVTGIGGTPGNFVLQTGKGPVRARNIIVATNGYTGPVTRWNRRRVIPIGSYVLATERLTPEQITRLIPNDRVVTDTRKLVVYYRYCPKGERIVFGGRVSITESDPTVAAPALHRELVKCFPELHATAISHAWMGFVAYTFNEMPHLGEHNGIHYSMGYCGSGVSLASYFGRKIGQQVVGDSAGRSPLTGIRAESRPYYFGRPWFLAPSISYYRWADGRGAAAG